MPTASPAGRATPSQGRLLMVGINYRPEQTGIAPYTAGLAEYLASRGRQVTVVTGMPHYPQWQVRDGYEGRLRTREQMDEVRVLRLRHYVPGRQSAWRRALYEGSFLLHGLTAGSLPRPDAVVGVVPSLSGGALARMLAWRFRVPYGLIFQDLMGPAAAQSGIAGGGRAARAVRTVEGSAARAAALVAAVSQGFFPYLTDLGVPPEKLLHLPNWAQIRPPGSERESTRRQLGWDSEVQVALHAGNMGAKQGLDQVLDAARLAARQGRSIRFVLMGDGNQRAALQEQARGLANVTFLPPRPASEFPDVLAAADVLLVSERASVRDMSLPSKLTSYFTAGGPVLAAVRPDGATAREVERSGAGLVVPAGEPAPLIDALDRLAADRLLRERLAEAGRAYARAALRPDLALARADEFVARLVGGGLAAPINQGAVA